MKIIIVHPPGLLLPILRRFCGIRRDKKRR